MISRSYDSPIGPITLSAKAGRLLGLKFGYDHDTEYRYSYPSHPDEPVLDQACEELDAYFAGRLKRFTVPIALMGSPFQLKIWSILLRIPFGKTLSYRELSALIGKPDAARAVGAANAANPLALIVPCHRVVGKDGSMTGFNGGVETKRALLDHERADAELFAAAMG